MNFGATLRQLYESRGFTQATVATRAGVSRHTVLRASALENCDLRPTTLDAIIEAINSKIPLTTDELGRLLRAAGWPVESVAARVAEATTVAAQRRITPATRGPFSPETMQSLSRLVDATSEPYVRGLLDSLYMSAVMGWNAASTPSATSVPSDLSDPFPELPDRVVKLTKPPVQREGYYEETTQYFGTADKSARPAQSAKPKALKRKAR